MKDDDFPVKHPGDILTAKELAEEYRLSERTLANMRVNGTGPQFVKFGKRMVRYRRADIEAFIAGAGRGGEQ